MKDYYKIGEISKIYGIGKDSLMYYEKLGLLNPTRGENGYRFYSLTDLWRLNLIKELRSLDFSMKKIKDYLDNRSLASTKEILSKEINLIDEKVEQLLKERKNIFSRLSQLNEVAHQEAEAKIYKCHLEERRAFYIHENITRDEEVDFLIQKLNRTLEEKFYIVGNKHIGAVFNLDQLKKGIYNEFQAVFCLLEPDDPHYNLVLKAGDYISAHYKGDYKNNKTCMSQMLKYMEQEGYTMDGNPIEIYKIDIHETGYKEEFVTEIQIPIKEDKGFKS